MATHKRISVMYLADSFYCTRVANIAALRWAKWEHRVKLLLVQSGESWQSNAELDHLIHSDSELFRCI